MIELQGRSRIDLELPCPQTDRACNFQRAAGGFDGPVVDERSRNRGGGGDIFQRSPGIDLKYSGLDRRVPTEGECVACRISTAAPTSFTTSECAAAAWSIVRV